MFESLVYDINERHSAAKYEQQFSIFLIKLQNFRKLDVVNLIVSNNLKLPVHLLFLTPEIEESLYYLVSF